MLRRDFFKERVSWQIRKRTSRANLSRKGRQKRNPPIASRRCFWRPASHRQRTPRSTRTVAASRAKWRTSPCQSVVSRERRSPARSTRGSERTAAIRSRTSFAHGGASKWTRPTRRPCQSGSSSRQWSPVTSTSGMRGTAARRLS